MNNKTVLLVRNVAPWMYGGGETYQLKLAGKLTRAGFTPIIVTNSKELLKRADDMGVKTLVPPYMKNQNWSGWRNVLLCQYMWFQRRLKKWYLEILEQYAPVVVNIQSRDDMIAGTIACKKKRIKVLWTDHADFRNWVLWNVNAKFKNAIGKKIIKLSKNVDEVVFVSKKVAEETEKMIWPLTLGNTMVINNGVRDEYEEFKNARSKECSFVFIGRVVKEKGVGELVDAFKSVIKKYPEATLNVYGNGEIEKYKRKVGDGVVFHGATTEPLKALADNEVFVLPSYREGMSLSLLEATMMGKKIVASDADGNSEVIDDKEIGLLVPVRNVEKLAEAMNWMLDNKKQAEKMAKNARKKYEKEYDLDRIFEEKMLPLYNKGKE